MARPMFKIKFIKNVNGNFTIAPLNIELSLILFLLSFPAHAAWGKADIDKPASTVEFKHKRYYVDNIIHINATPERVIDSLTDYPNLKNIIPSVSSARLLEANSNYDLVETTLYNCVLFFCKKLTNVQKVMITDKSITALTIPDDSDFKYAFMTWQIEQDSGATTVTYHAEIELNFWIPPLIGPSILKHKLKKENILVSKALDSI